MVAQASERTGKSVASLLQAFGRYWILFTARSTYGDLLDGSDDLESFLFQLNSLHESVATSMPKLIPPSFGVEPSDSGLIVLYVSEREGLEPMVTGLLEGLLETFGLDGDVHRLDDSSYGERRFLIRADEQ